MMTTWRKEIEEVMGPAGECWGDIVATTLTEEELGQQFNPGYIGAGGVPFCVWTAKRVYFPAVYDGSEWVESVSRDPDGKPVGHVGGG